MFENCNTYEGKLAAQLAQWQAASEKARESEKAWLDITSRYQSSAETG